MRLAALTKTRLILAAAGILMAAVVVVVILSRGGAARAEGPTETPFVSYKAPTGPELSSSAAANEAVRYAREFGDDGEVTVELARGTMTQAATLMEGGSLAAAQAKESQQRSDTPSSTFCFGGRNANCSTTEQQHAKEVLSAEGHASTYLVALSGGSFTPPERLPAGQKPISGNLVILLLDAHTGIREGITVGPGTTAPNLNGLQGPSRFVAAAQATTAETAATKPTHSHPVGVTPTKPNHSHPLPGGSVIGTFTRNGEVIVFSGRAVFDRARVSHRRFEIRAISTGNYSIAGRLPSGRYCHRTKIVVRPRRETIVHLAC